MAACQEGGSHDAAGWPKAAHVHRGMVGMVLKGRVPRMEKVDAWYEALNGLTRSGMERRTMEAYVSETARDAEHQLTLG